MITYDEMKATLQAVVEENPDRRNDGCFYVRNNEPHCIAAVVLVRLGVSLDTLSAIEGQSIGPSLQDAKVVGLPAVEPDAGRLLDEAQATADSSYNPIDGCHIGDACNPWNIALTHAINRIERNR